MTEDKISELLHFLAEHYPRLMPIAFMGAYYGLRRSEILGMKWFAVDFEKKLIHITHMVAHVKSIDESDNTKTPEGRRSLNLFPNAEKCLLHVKKEQEENREFFKSKYQNQEGYVFTWENGHCYKPYYITTAFGKATAAFGRPEITLHKLRHSCVSMIINK